MRAEKKKCRKDDYSIKASTGGSDCTDRPVQAGKAAYTKHLQGGGNISEHKPVPHD